jgi:16S rRNA G966 N2-methylase RsmD
VGLEALSRGAAECHFVEIDPWVTRTVLGKNITACGFNKKSVVRRKGCCCRPCCCCCQGAGPHGAAPAASRAPAGRLPPVAVPPRQPPTTATAAAAAAPQVHTMRAEEFLEKTVQFPKYAGGAFDFVSLCPPYQLVSYPQLFRLFDQGQLLHPGSIMFVEYPKQLKHQVPDTLGPLEVVRDRKYGRTCVAVYAAPETQL